MLKAKSPTKPLCTCTVSRKLSLLFLVHLDVHKLTFIASLTVNGGVDSYSMLAPRTCAPIDVYQRYTNTRGSVALTLDKQLEINGNNLGQPCQTFGIHQNLPALKSLYDQGELIFVANAGLLVKPVTSKNYRETPLSLFGHSSMSRETLSDDLYDEFGGTGKKLSVLQFKR